MRMYSHYYIVGFLLFQLLSGEVVFSKNIFKQLDKNRKTCQLPVKLIDEIAAYSSVVQKIIDATVDGSFKGETYRELAKFIDTFGNRLSGTENLEDAIDYMLALSRNASLENVHGEKVEVPFWVRGNESAFMVSPRRMKLEILGLGSSVGTPPNGIVAKVLVVDSFDDLEANGQQAKGKIVVFNQNYTTYGKSVVYRQYGASKAAKYGAVASLIRSITDFSMNTPHTGWQDYEDGTKRIPTACITVEDAHMLQRLQERGITPVIELHMDAKMKASPKVSRNTVAEITGGTAEGSNSVVIVSGHLDSWDVGQGAMDDGAGAFISWAALALLKRLNLRPKRTLRAVLWTGEEEGLVGAKAYYKLHDPATINFIMESDEGTFQPLGLEYSADPFGSCVLDEITKLLTLLNATQLVRTPSVGSDIMLWIRQGIPGASLLNKDDKYFWYHHSGADTIDIEDSDILDKCTALWAAVAYVVADISASFPKFNPGVSFSHI